MPRNEIFESLERRRGKERQFRENAAREATNFLTFRTEGAGFMTSGDLEFDTPFLDEPNVTTGLVMERPPNDDYWQMPLVTAGVVRWSRNNRGFYVGAFLFVHVRVDLLDELFHDPEFDNATAPKARPRFIHHFSFSALSYKSMGDETYESVAEEPLTLKQMPRVP